jgi:hypothetical protein
MRRVGAAIRPISAAATVTEDAAMGPTLALPQWVSRRDGRLEPFESDRICRSLFAALADLGRPDAFLARELTDGILHFLAGEFDAAPSTGSSPRSSASWATPPSPSATPPAPPRGRTGGPRRPSSRRRRRTCA